MAEGVDAAFFGSPDYVPIKAEMNIADARKERGILPEAQERFNFLLEEKGWRQIRELEGGVVLPNLDEWVQHRIENRRGTKFFPCFIQDTEGNVFFVKTQVTENEDHLSSLANEAEILKGFNEMGFPSPKFYEYGDGGDRTLAYIRLEAITPDVGRVAVAEEWTEKHALSAVEQIKRMEEVEISFLPENLKEMAAFRDGVRVVEVMIDLVNRAGGYLPVETKERLLGLWQKGEEVRMVLAHGDLALKNIVIDGDGRVLPVDFELAKLGFLGQDMGKLLSGLMDNPDVFVAALRSYVGSDRERLRAVMVAMATENLVHLVWRVENGGEDMEKFKQKIEVALGLNELLK